MTLGSGGEFGRPVGGDDARQCHGRGQCGRSQRGNLVRRGGLGRDGWGVGLEDDGRRIVRVHRA